MTQVYDKTKPISGTTTFGQLYQILRDHADAAATLFSGTAFPTVVAADAGRPCFRTDRLTANGVPKLYIYTGLPALGESGWVEVSANSVIGEEVVNARGSKSSLDQRLDMALNEDGTLKASTTLNPSQWSLPSLTFTYLSTTSFKVNGDQTDIYKSTRRLKINLGASTPYTEVLSASYSAPDTTIQVLDAVLDNTLVSVEHSLFLPDKDNGAISSRMVGKRRIKSIVFADSPYNATIHDEVILVDASGGAVTINALAAATMGAGRRQEVIKTDSSANAVTIDPNGSETINGNATLAISVPLTGVEYESDGSNLRTRDDQTAKLTAADLVQDHVVAGLLGADPGASLSMTIPPGTAYVIGRRVVKLAGASDLTRVYTASKDTYVDISHTGAITYQEQTLGGAAPAVAANSLRLMKVVTNGTEITGVTDLRVLTGGLEYRAVEKIKNHMLYIPEYAFARRVPYRPIKATTVATGYPSYHAIYAEGSIWVSCGASPNDFVKRINPLDGSVIATITGMTAPSNLVYDSVNRFIWVGSQTGQILSKIDPSTNTVVDTIDLGAGNTDSRCGVFDGTNLWFEVRATSSLKKINPVTKAVLATVAHPSAAYGLTFDGTHIWVPNFGSNNCSKVNVATNGIDATVTVGTAPWGAFFDGQFVWCSNYTSSTVSKINPATDAVVATANLQANAGPHGMAFDGRRIWVALSNPNAVELVNCHTQVVEETLLTGVDPAAIAYDGTFMWVANYQSTYLSRIQGS